MTGEIVLHGDDDGNYNKVVFRSRNGVRGSVPEFLTKTYNIVNDPNTDSVVSWGSSANSFIIWDHNEFSATVIPRFFRHNNLSSFVYQLNNYGFKKIGVDHEWEYANPNFQAGKEYLLQNIKRRAQIRETLNDPSPSRRSIINNRLEVKKEILRNRIGESKVEIERLRIRQSELERQIAAVESEIESSRRKSDERTAARDYESWRDVINGSAGTGVQNSISMDLRELIAKLADRGGAGIGTYDLDVELPKCPYRIGSSKG